MTRRLKIARALNATGCALFTLYGLVSALLSKRVSAYLFHADTGADFAALGPELQGFAAATVVTVGLLGAGLAVASGILFWLGFTHRLRPALIAAVLGGGIGLGGLITVHLDQRAWILFILDNVFLNLIGAGFTVAGKEMLEILRGQEKV